MSLGRCLVGIPPCRPPHLISMRSQRDCRITNGAKLPRIVSTCDNVVPGLPVVLQHSPLLGTDLRGRYVYCEVSLSRASRKAAIAPAISACAAVRSRPIAASTVRKSSGDGSRHTTLWHAVRFAARRFEADFALRLVDCRATRRSAVRPCIRHLFRYSHSATCSKSPFPKVGIHSPVLRGTRLYLWRHKFEFLNG